MEKLYFLLFKIALDSLFIEGVVAPRPTKQVALGAPRDSVTITFGTGELTGVFARDHVCIGDVCALVSPTRAFWRFAFLRFLRFCIFACCVFAFCVLVRFAFRAFCVSAFLRFCVLIRLAAKPRQIFAILKFCLGD